MTLLELKKKIDVILKTSPKLSDKDVVVSKINDDSVADEINRLQISFDFDETPYTVILID